MKPTHLRYFTPLLLLFWQACMSPVESPGDIEVCITREIVFPPVAHKTFADRLLMVANCKQDSVRIDGIVINSPDSGTFTLSDGPGFPITLGGVDRIDTVYYTVRYTPADTTRDYGSATVSTNVGTVTVSLEGGGATQGESPTPCITPSLTFIEPLTDIPFVIDTVTVWNCGGDSLHVDSIRIQGPAFSLPGEVDLLPLAADEQLTLEVRYAPKDATPDTGAITVYSSSGSATCLLLGAGRVEGNIVLCADPLLLAFGSVASSDNFTLSEVALIACEGDSVLVTAVWFTNTNFDLGNPGAVPVMVYKDQPVDVSVRYAPKRAVKDTGTMFIASTGGLVAVDLRGDGLEKTDTLSICAAPLHFPQVTKDPGFIIDTLELTNCGTTPIHILAIEIGLPVFTVLGPTEFTDVPVNATILVPIRYKPDDVGVDDTFVTITGDVSKGVQLTGQGIAPRSAQVPKSLNLGSSRPNLCADPNLGMRVQGNVLVENTGDDEITVTVTAIDAPFETTVQSVKVVRNSFANIPVKFCPTSTGDNQGTLKLSADATSGPTSFTVNLTGKGITYQPSDNPAKSPSVWSEKVLGDSRQVITTQTKTVRDSIDSFAGKTKVLLTVGKEKDSLYVSTYDADSVSFYTTLPVFGVAGCYVRKWLRFPSQKISGGSTTSCNLIISDTVDVLSDALLSINKKKIPFKRVRWIREAATLAGHSQMVYRSEVELSYSPYLGMIFITSVRQLVNGKQTSLRTYTIDSYTFK